MVCELVRHHARMRVMRIAITIAGAFCGGLTLVLLLSGWLGLVPYALMAAGYSSSSRPLIGADQLQHVPNIEAHLIGEAGSNAASIDELVALIGRQE